MLYVLREEEANKNMEDVMNWRLPDKEELNLMYENLHKKGIGGFTNTFYWSSSEHSAVTAWIQGFYYGHQYYSNKGNKDGGLWVRAVRAFQSDKNYKIGDITETGIIFHVNENIYKECKFKDELEHHTWYESMESFEERGNS